MKEVFHIHIFLNQKNKAAIEVDCEKIYCTNPFGGKSKELIEYIDLFSKITYEHRSSLKYMISDTLTRIEDRTYLLDKLTKYIEIISLIENNNQNITIKNMDWTLYKALVKFLKSNKIDFKASQLKSFLFTSESLVKFFFKVALSILLDIILIIVSKLLYSMPRKRDYDYAFLSFYDNRCNHNGVYRDAYFHPLVEYLLNKENDVMIFSTLIFEDSPWHFYKYISNIKKMLKDIKHIEKKCEVKIHNRFMTIGSLLKAYLKGITGFIQLKENIIYRGCEISNIINFSLLEDYFRCDWKYAWKQYYFAKSIFADFKIGRIIYPYENHPWEKLLVSARNNTKNKTELIGFQHSSFSLKILQYFPGKHEKILSIYPDKILTVGDILRDVMNEFGSYKNGLVESGCALRHEYLFKEIKMGGGDGLSRKIAYAFSSDTKTYSRIINILIKAFQDTEYTVFLKIHPIVSTKAVIKMPPPHNIVPAKHMQWNELFEQIDLLLYDDNSIGIEALKYGVDVVYSGLSGLIYNCDRMFKYNGDKLTVNSLEDLKSFISDYYSGKIKTNFNPLYNQEYLHQYFLPITSERMDKFL